MMTENQRKARLKNLEKAHEARRKKKDCSEETLNKLKKIGKKLREKKDKKCSN